MWFWNVEMHALDVQVVHPEPGLFRDGGRAVELAMVACAFENEIDKLVLLEALDVVVREVLDQRRDVDVVATSFRLDDIGDRRTKVRNELRYHCRVAGRLCGLERKRAKATMAVR